MEEAGDDAAAIESAVDSAAPAMPPGWLDVTTAVRFMVGDSNLQFHKAGSCCTADSRRPVDLRGWKSEAWSPCCGAITRL